MTGFITTTQVVGYSGVEPDDVRVTVLVDLVTSAIQAVTGQTFFAVTGDVYEATASAHGRLSLPQQPATAVTSLTVNGTAVTDFKLANDLVLACEIYPCADVVVTYNHGYATIPGDVQAVALAAVTRTLAQAPGVKSESFPSYSVQYEDTVGSLLTPEEVGRLCRRYGRAPQKQSVKSVRLTGQYPPRHLWGQQW